MLSSLIPLSAILVLLIVAFLLVAIRISLPGFAYTWIIAALAALLAWVLVFFSRLEFPQSIQLITWRPEAIFPVSPALIVDHISWSFAVALVTLALSVILTGVARASEAEWSAWASILFLIAIGLVAVMADNPLTLVLAWAALDLTELIIYFWYVESTEMRESAIVAFAIRIGGIWLLLLGATIAGLFDTTLTFDVIPKQISVFLLLAAVLRIGVLPQSVGSLREFPARRGLGTILRLIPAAASLVLLSRVATAGVPTSLTPYLLILFGITAIYAGILWIGAKDELDGRHYWILGMGAITAAASVRGQSEASLAWGLATIFSGGLLFLYSARNRYLMPLLVLGLMGFSGLLFTPMWYGMRLYTTPIRPELIILVIAHAMLLAGYLWHAMRSVLPLTGVERWVLVVYPWGISLLPLVQLLLSWWGQFTGVQAKWTGTYTILVLPSIITLGLAALMFLGLRKGLAIPEDVQTTLDSVFSLRWYYHILRSGFRSLGSAFGFLSNVLEGEGGILWALLLMILLLVFAATSGLGGT